mgnify:CR=1 FL=1
MIRIYIKEMFLKFFAIFLLFVLFTPGFNSLNKKNNYYYLLASLLFTGLFYMLMLCFRRYREGYTESYKITFNGISDLVKVIEEMVKKEEINKTVVINNELINTKK